MSPVLNELSMVAVEKVVFRRLKVNAKRQECLTEFEKLLSLRMRRLRKNLIEGLRAHAPAQDRPTKGGRCGSFEG